MTTTAAPARVGSVRILGFAYGVAAYVAFLGVFLYAVAFVEDAKVTVGGTLLVPRTIDRGGPDTGTATAVVVDVLLLSLFAVQHSVMARTSFKRWLTRHLPASVERSTFVLAASACLALLEWGWHPVTGTVWDVSGAGPRGVLRAVSLAGFGLVLASTFLINHFDLFGLRQVTAALRGRTLPAYTLVTPLWYAVVRHPIYLGFLIAFWVTPTMTAGHLLFAAMTTGYILVGIWFEERDLVAQFGEAYRAYRRRVPMLVPGRRRA
ncbi:methanethiol S-methyltransferase [Nocardioides sp. KR10-350]|uniref:methanethiol S-methyltransferase n=1 Tax=Nocardioides cheoyonin TaxID=3156615 RepID=UPI0032B46E3E